MLLAFTQLCRSTRGKFLPWLWEHVQSLCVYLPGLEEQECRRMAKAVFRRQSKTLLTTPSFAAHVKYVSISLATSHILT